MCVQGRVEKHCSKSRVFTLQCRCCSLFCVCRPVMIPWPVTQCGAKCRCGCGSPTWTQSEKRHGRQLQHRYGKCDELGMVLLPPYDGVGLQLQGALWLCRSMQGCVGRCKVHCGCVLHTAVVANIGVCCALPASSPSLVAQVAGWEHLVAGQAVKWLSWVAVSTCV
jgi:hypothetical protein